MKTNKFPNNVKVGTLGFVGKEVGKPPTPGGSLLLNYYRLLARFFLPFPERDNKTAPKRLPIMYFIRSLLEVKRECGNIYLELLDNKMSFVLM